MSKKKFIHILAALLLSTSIMAQEVAQNIIVEHFTNTRCSICANRNQGFYQNLDNHPSVLHISYHPSSPYSNCLLNNHNPMENDERTKYYGIYGGTPRLVIQGTVIPASTNYSEASLFVDYENKTSPISIEVTQELNEDASIITIYTTLKNEAAHNLSDLIILAGVAENIIFYDSPNGETEHKDVFRKAGTDISGNPVSITGNAGEEKKMSFTVAVSNEWDLARIFSYVILQEKSMKAVVQSNVSPAEFITTTAVRDVTDLVRTSVSPTITDDIIQLLSEENKPVNIEIYSVSGNLLYRDVFTHQKEVRLNQYPTGVYLVKLYNEAGILTKKVLKQ